MSGEIENAPLYEEEYQDEEGSEVFDETLSDEDELALRATRNEMHQSLVAKRCILIVDEEGPRRDETVEIIDKILPNAEISVSNGPEEALKELNKEKYDTYVVNLLMPGYSSSEFVKQVLNHPQHPLLVGFSSDKMSDAYDPKKGIKFKPLRRLFEITTFENAVEGNMEDEEELE